MPAFPAGAWRPFDLAVAFTIALSGMAQGGGFVITGRLKVDGGSVDGSTMVVYREGQKQRTVSTDLNKFSLELDLNTSYVLSFEKDGFVTKKLSFDTHAPAAAITNGFTPFAFVVSLFKQYDGVNTVVFNQPVGMIRYDANLADFDYDTDYTKSIQSALAEAQDAVTKKQAEEEMKADEAAKDKAAMDKQKAKDDAKAEKEAQDKAKELAKAKQNPVIAAPTAQAEPPVEATAVKKDAPKAVRPKPEPPRPKVNTSLASAVEGNDLRRTAKAGVAEEASRVRPARAHIDMDPRPKFEASPVTPVRQEQLIIEPNQVVTVVRLERGDAGTEYRKVVRKYSGTFYFKDGESCSKLTYENGALAEVGH